MALIVKSKTIKLSLEWNDNDDNPDLDEGSSHAPSEAAKEDVVKEEEQEQMEDDSDYRSLASIASQSSSEAANETIEEFEEEDDFVKHSPVSLPDSSMVKSTIMECLKGKKIILV